MSKDYGHSFIKPNDENVAINTIVAATDGLDRAAKASIDKMEIAYWKSIVAAEMAEADTNKARHADNLAMWFIGGLFFLWVILQASLFVIAA